MAVNTQLNTSGTPITVAEGGSGVATMTTAYAPVCAGTTATGPLQVASSGQGTSGFVLTSTGSSSLPTWQASSGTGTVNSGTANQIAYYASSGTAVSGLTGANGSVLVTSNTGVPSMLANPSADRRMLASANGAIPAWSTSSYADTYSVSTLLYASSANTVTGLATTNRASLSTNSTGVPTWLALTDGQVVVGSSAGSPAAATLTAGSGISITNASNAITIATSSGTVSGEAKFWLSAAGAGTSINASFNVTSITDTGAGKLGVTIGTDFSSANWCCNVSITQASLGTKIVYLTAQAAGTCAVESSTGSVATDPTNYFCAGFGDQ